MERIIDQAMDTQKALGVTGGFKSLYLTLLSMGHLRLVVKPFLLAVLDAGYQRPTGHSY